MQTQNWWDHLETSWEVQIFRIMDHHQWCKLSQRCSNMYCNGKQAFKTLDNILRNKKQSVNVNTRVLECYFWPVLLYGCGMRTLTAALIRNLETAEIWVYQKTQIISYMAKKTNKQKVTQVNQSRSLFETRKKQQFEFFGHIIGGKQLEHLVICGKICGKNAWGRPRKMYRDKRKDWLNLSTARILQLATW